MAAEEEDVYTKEELSKLTNPKYFGPGLWVGIHKLARYSDQNDQKIYPGFIKSLCEDFNCSACRPHCIDNITKDPPEKYIGQKWGMSWHSFNFHNRANKALGKKIMSWKQYAKIYLNSDPEKGIVYCKEGCGDEPAFANSHQHHQNANQNANQNAKKSPERIVEVQQQMKIENFQTQGKRSEKVDPRAFKELWVVSKRDPELAHHKKNKKHHKNESSRGDTLHIHKK